MKYSWFSVFNFPITNRRPYTAVSMEQLARGIQSNMKIMQMHERYKEAVHKGMNPVEAKKRLLQWFPVGGIFNYPDASGLERPSYETILDVDHCDADKVEELKARLFNDDILFPDLVFTSPSDKGVKALISYPMPEGNIVKAHKEITQAIMDYYDATYGTDYPKADRSGCDITRRCYLCHDAAALYRIVDITNWENRISEILPKKEDEAMAEAMTVEPLAMPTLRPADDKDPIRFLHDMTNVIEREHRDIAPEEKHFSDLTFAIANSCGEAGRPFYYRICGQWSKGSNDPKYLAEKYDYALKNGRGKNGIGTVYHLFTQAGLTINKHKL